MLCLDHWKTIVVNGQSQEKHSMVMVQWQQAHWKTIESNGAPEKNHYHPIVLKKIPSSKSTMHHKSMKELETWRQFFFCFVCLSVLCVLVCLFAYLLVWQLLFTFAYFHCVLALGYWTWCLWTTPKWTMTFGLWMTMFGLLGHLLDIWTFGLHPSDLLALFECIFGTIFYLR